MAIKTWGCGKLLRLRLQVQQGSVVAAGAVVTPGKTVPSGEVWAGSPAKLLRKLEEEETGFIAQVWHHHDSELLPAYCILMPASGSKAIASLYCCQRC